MGSLVLPFINLIMLLAILAYFLRKPLAQFVKTRHQTIRTEVDEVRERLKKAQAQHQDFTAKLGAIDAEIAAYRSQATKDGEEFKSRIVEAANTNAGQMVQEAQVRADGMFADLKSELKRELVEKIIQSSEAIIRERITSDDQARFRKEFAHKLEVSS